MPSISVFALETTIVSISKTMSRTVGDFSFNANIPVALQAASSGLSDGCALAAETAKVLNISVLINRIFNGTPKLGEMPKR